MTFTPKERAAILANPFTVPGYATQIEAEVGAAILDSIPELPKPAPVVPRPVSKHASLHLIEEEARRANDWLSTAEIARRVMRKHPRRISIETLRSQVPRACQAGILVRRHIGNNRYVYRLAEYARNEADGFPCAKSTNRAKVKGPAAHPYAQPAQGHTPS